MDLINNRNLRHNTSDTGTNVTCLATNDPSRSYQLTEKPTGWRDAKYTTKIPRTATLRSRRDTQLTTPPLSGRMPPHRPTPTCSHHHHGCDSCDDTERDPNCHDRQIRLRQRRYTRDWLRGACPWTRAMHPSHGGRMDTTLAHRETKEEQVGQHHDDTRPQRDKRVTQHCQPKADHAPSHGARPPSSAKTYDAVHTLAPQGHVLAVPKVPQEVPAPYL